MHSNKVKLFHGLPRRVYSVVQKNLNTARNDAKWGFCYSLCTIIRHRDFMNRGERENEENEENEYYKKDSYMYVYRFNRFGLFKR